MMEIPKEYTAAGRSVEAAKIMINAEKYREAIEILDKASLQNPCDELQFEITALYELIRSRSIIGSIAKDAELQEREIFDQERSN